MFKGKLILFLGFLILAGYSSILLASLQPSTSPRYLVYQVVGVRQDARERVMRSQTDLAISFDEDEDDGTSKKAAEAPAAPAPVANEPAVSADPAVAAQSPQEQPIEPVPENSQPIQQQQEGSANQQPQQKLQGYTSPKPVKPFCPPQGEERPLLVLATTMMDGDGPLREKIQRNTLISLKALEPEVKVVLFTDRHSNWNRYAKEIKVETTDQFETNDFGAPIFRSMIEYLESVHEATLYAYVNGDILLSEDFLKTIRSLTDKVCSGELGPRILAIGKRKNTEEIPELDPRKKPFEAIYELRKGAQTFIKEALDYFIMSKSLFEWSNPRSFPDFVIGRAHYDNAIAVMSQRTGAVVIDASKTITAIHQNEEHGNFSGDRKDREPLDRKWNLKIPNPMNLTFDELRNGHVGIAHFSSVYENKDIVFVRTEQPEPFDVYS